LVCSVVFIQFPIHSTETPPSECDIEANYIDEGCEPVGYGSSEATSTGISISMVGWGLGLAAAIAIIAGVLHQSVATHAATTNPDDSSSS